MSFSNGWVFIEHVEWIYVPSIFSYEKLNRWKCDNICCQMREWEEFGWDEHYESMKIIDSDHLGGPK